MSEFSIGLPGRNLPPRDHSASVRGGIEKAANQSPLQARRAAHRLALREYVRGMVRRLYGDDAIPALEGGLVFREMSERTGEPESVLMALAVELGVWVSSPQRVANEWKAKVDGRNG